MFTFGLSMAVTGQASDWTTKGKTEARQQAAGEWPGAVAMQPVWQRVLGPSGAQPVLVGQTIYHLAGRTLWRITPDGKAEALVDMVNNKHFPTSGITYATINGTGVLYFGTGDNLLCAKRLESDGALHCIRLEGTEPVVAVPLVFPPGGGRSYDVVVMGDKNGNLWVAKNLANPDLSKLRYNKFPVGGGWLLASPVPIGPQVDLGFIFGVDNGTGTVGARRVITGGEGDLPDLENVWDFDVHTQSGVADGFANDSEYAYVADKAGVFQRIRRLTHEQAPLIYGATFANASPAVDETTIYFVLRQGPDSQTGRLVAIDKARWTAGAAAVKWTRDLPAPANTNPLILIPKDGGSPVVVVGDTKGHLYAFNEADGSPYAFVEGIQAQLTVGDIGRTGEWYQALTGVIDPILAAGTGDSPFLITGLSGQFDPTPFLADQANKDLVEKQGACPGTGSRDCGVLVAYRTQAPAIDLAAGAPVAPTQLPCIPGAQQQITWTVTNNAAGPVSDVPYQVVVTGASGYRRTLRDTRRTLDKGVNQDMEFIYIRCGETYTVTVHVNDPPDDNKSLRESDYTNNHSATTIAVDPYNDNVGVAETDAGSSRVLIIPADCKVDPNLPPDAPCSNYRR